MPRTVTVRTPGPPSVDPDSGNTVPGPVVRTVTRAYLSQQSVAVLSASTETAGRQDTTISSYTLIVPASVALNEKSQVVDEDGHVYRVNGQPAERRALGRRVLFRAAAMHRITDLQA
jgi:hypothetical protein